MGATNPRGVKQSSGAMRRSHHERLRELTKGEIPGDNNDVMRDQELNTIEAKFSIVWIWDASASGKHHRAPLGVLLCRYGTSVNRSGGFHEMLVSKANHKIYNSED